LITYIVQLAEQAVSAARIPSCHQEVIVLIVVEAVLAAQEQAQVTTQRGEDCIIILLVPKHPWLVKLLWHNYTDLLKGGNISCLCQLQF
jgi:hypothetical protein